MNVFDVTTPLLIVSVIAMSLYAFVWAYRVNKKLKEDDKK